MSTTTPDVDAPEDIERDAKALTEAMVVDRHQGLTDQYVVYSGETGEYLVDLAAGSCDCPDALHRGVTCKHTRRVLFATGRRSLPAWVDDESEIDRTLVLQRRRFADE